VANSRHAVDVAAGWIPARPALSANPGVNTRVLLKLMHEIRSAARRTRESDRIELVYKDRHAVRLHG